LVESSRMDSDSDITISSCDVGNQNGARMKARDYSSGSVTTSRITNSRICQDYLGDLKHRQMLRFYGDYRKLFRELWGKPDFHYRGERDYHVWVKDCEGVELVVLTAKSMGTCYEIVVEPGQDYNPPDESCEKVVSFLKQLLPQLPELSI
jgi:hypothetical protein